MASTIATAHYMMLPRAKPCSLARHYLPLASLHTMLPNFGNKPHLIIRHLPTRSAVLWRSVGTSSGKGTAQPYPLPSAPPASCRGFQIQGAGKALHVAVWQSLWQLVGLPDTRSGQSLTRGRLAVSLAACGASRCKERAKPCSPARPYQPLASHTYNITKFW